MGTIKNQKGKMNTVINKWVSCLITLVATLMLSVAFGVGEVKAAGSNIDFAYASSSTYSGNNNLITIKKSTDELSDLGITDNTNSTFTVDSVNYKGLRFLHQKYGGSTNNTVNNGVYYHGDCYYIGGYKTCPFTDSIGSYVLGDETAVSSSSNRLIHISLPTSYEYNGALVVWDPTETFYQYNLIRCGDNLANCTIKPYGSSGLTSSLMGENNDGSLVVIDSEKFPIPSGLEQGKDGNGWYVFDNNTSDGYSLVSKDLKLQNMFQDAGFTTGYYVIEIRYFLNGTNQMIWHTFTFRFVDEDDSPIATNATLDKLGLNAEAIFASSTTDTGTISVMPNGTNRMFSGTSLTTSVYGAWFHRISVKVEGGTSESKYGGEISTTARTTFTVTAKYNKMVYIYLVDMAGNAYEVDVDDVYCSIGYKFILFDLSTTGASAKVGWLNETNMKDRNNFSTSTIYSNSASPSTATALSGYSTSSSSTYSHPYIGKNIKPTASIDSDITSKFSKVSYTWVTNKSTTSICSTNTCEVATDKVSTPDSYTITVTFSFGYDGEKKSFTFSGFDTIGKLEVNTCSISEGATITANSAYVTVYNGTVRSLNCTFKSSATGSEVSSTVSTSVSGNKFTEDSDGIVGATVSSTAHSALDNAGVYTVTNTGKAAYYIPGSNSSTVTIEKANVGSVTITGVSAEYVYTGSEIKPLDSSSTTVKVTLKTSTNVTLSSLTLVKNDDISVSYANNVNVGTASIFISALDKFNFRDTSTAADKTFLIVKTDIPPCSGNPNCGEDRIPDIPPCVITGTCESGSGIYPMIYVYDTYNLTNFTGSSISYSYTEHTGTGYYTKGSISNKTYTASNLDANSVAYGFAVIIATVNDANYNSVTKYYGIIIRKYASTLTNTTSFTEVTYGDTGKSVSTSVTTTPTITATIANKGVTVGTRTYTSGDTNRLTLGSSCTDTCSLTIKAADNNSVNITVTLSETATVKGASITITIVIKKANMNVSVEPYYGEYDGQTHYAKAKVTKPTSAKIKYGTAANTKPNELTLNTSFVNLTAMGRKDVGKTDIYYTITADNYNDVTGTTAVEIISGKLPDPTNVAWLTTSGNGGKVSWTASSGVGSVTVAHYELKLFKSGTANAVYTTTTTTTTYDFSAKLREKGAGIYTASVQAISSDVTACDNSSAVQTTNNQAVRQVTVSKGTDAGIKSVYENGNVNTTSYYMVANQSAMAIVATLNNGYDFYYWSWSNTESEITVANYQSSETSVTFSGSTTTAITITAVSKIHKYTITYKNGTTTLGTQNYYVTDATFAVEYAVSQAGYTFTGWKVITVGNYAYEDSSGIAIAVGDIIETVYIGSYADITVNAQWRINEITVCILKDGAAWNNSGVNVRLKNGNTVSKSLTFTSTTSNCSTWSGVGFNTYTVEASKRKGDTTTYGSVGSVTISGSESQKSININYCTVTIRPSNSSLGKVSSGGDIVLYGQTYYRNSTPNIVNVSNFSSTATTIANNGYTVSFVNWTVDGTVVGTTSVTITKAITIIANFTRSAKSYTVTYDVNGGILASGKENPQYYTVTTPTFPLHASTDISKTGYTFGGWKVTSIDGTAYADQNDTIAQNEYINQIYIGSFANIRVQAQWTPDDYIITFNKNGGSEIASVSYTIESGTIDLTDSEYKPTRTGYTFDGWKVITVGNYAFKDSVGTKITTGEIIDKVYSGSYADITLEAQWSANEVVITIRKNGSAWSNSGMKVALYQSSSEKYTYAAATKSGSTVKWTVVTSGTYDVYAAKSDKDVAVVKVGSITLDSKGKASSYVDYYEVSIAPNNSSYGTVDMAKIIVLKNQSYTVSGNDLVVSSSTITSSIIDQNGYDTKFLGWYVGNTKISSSTTITSSVNIEARFERSLIKYKVTYNTDGGSSIAYKEYTVETATFKISSTNPTKTGYTFKQWIVEDITDGKAIKNSSGSFMAKNDVVTDVYIGSYANITVKAVWDAVEYNITYLLNGGTLASGRANPVKYTITSSSVALYTSTDISRTGYTFKSWKVSEVSGVVYDETGSQTSTGKVIKAVNTGSHSDIKVEAQWDENVGTVTLNTIYNNMLVEMKLYKNGTLAASYPQNGEFDGTTNTYTFKQLVPGTYDVHTYVSLESEVIVDTGIDLSISSSTGKGSATVTYHTFDINPNDSAYGEISGSFFIGCTTAWLHGASISTSNDVLTISFGGHSKNYTAVVKDVVGYTTTFTGWTGKTSGTLTDADFATANFSRTKNIYTLKLYNGYYYASTDTNLKITSSSANVTMTSSEVSKTSPNATLSAEYNPSGTYTITFTPTTTTREYYLWLNIDNEAAWIEGKGALSFSWSPTGNHKIHWYVREYHTVQTVAGTGVATATFDYTQWDLITGKTQASIMNGMVVNTLHATVAAGYSFDGWYNGATKLSSNLDYAWNHTVVSDLTITAKATPNSLTFNGGTLKDGTYGDSYTSSAFAAATNGTGSYSYTISSGAPGGVTLNSSSRILSATAITGNAKTYSIVITVTDTKSNVTATATFTMVVNKRALSIKWPTQTKYTYQGSAHTITPTLENIYGTDSVSITGITGNQGTNVGNYTAKVTTVNNSNYSVPTNSFDWEITPLAIDTAAITLDNTNLVYTTNAQTKTVSSVVIGGLTIPEDSYSVSGNVQTNAGTYTLTVTATGNYTGYATTSWSISPRNMRDVTVADIASMEYTGSELKPEPVVTYEKDNLKTLNLITYTYSNNIDAGDNTASVTITAKTSATNYTGSITVTFTIDKKSLSGTFGLSGTATYGNTLTMSYTGGTATTATYDIAWQYHNGSSWVTIATAAGSESLVLSSSSVNGIATLAGKKVRITITGNENFTGSLTKESATISAKNVIASDITITPSSTVSKVYDGNNKVKQSFTFAFKSGVIVSGDTITIASVDANTATYSDANVADNKDVTIKITSSGTRIGNYTITDTLTTKGDIKPQSITSATVTLENTNLVYTGSALTKNVTSVVANGLTLPTSDYDVSGNSKTNAGTYTLTITAKNNFTGTFNVEWSIAKKSLADGDIEVTDIPNKTYTGSSITPTTTVKYNGMTLNTTDHITYSYSNNTNIGKATVKISAKENATNYTGYLETFFIIEAQAITGTVSITSSAVYGSTITLSYTGGNSASAVYNIQWKYYDDSAWVNIGGATGNSLVLNYRTTNIAVLAGKKVKVVLTGTGNYSSSIESTGQCEVTKKTVDAEDIIITPSATVTKVYDRTDIVKQSFTLKYATGVIETSDNVTISNIATNTAKYNNANVDDNKAVTLVVTKGGAQVDNYDIPSSVVTTGAITEKELTVSWNPSSPSFTYDGTTHTVTPSLVGVISGDTVNLTVINNSKVDAGTYTAEVTSISNSNYKLTGTLTKTWSISKATPTVTLTAVTGLVFDLASHDLVTSSVEEIAGNKLTVSYNVVYNGGTTTTTSIPKGMNAGTYTITMTATGNSNINTVVSNTVEVTIAKRNLSHDDVVIASVADVNYNGAAHKPTPTVTYKTETLNTTSHIKYTYSSDVVNVGTVTVTVTALDSATNYTGSKSITFEIKAIVATNPSLTPYSGTYDAQEHGITATGAVGGTVMYRVGTTGTWSTTNPKFKDVGNYVVYVYVKGNSNHTDSSVISSTVDIDPKKITITMTATTKVYDGTPDAELTCTYTGTEGGEDLNVSCSTGKASSANVGTHEIVESNFSIADGTKGKLSNYTYDAPTATLTITKATLTDTSTGYSGVYNGAAHNIVVAATGFKISDTLAKGSIQYRVGTNGSWTTTNPTRTHVSETPVTIYYKVTFTNYNTIEGSKTIVITPKDITLEVVAQNREYNGTTAISFTTCRALDTVNGETLTVNCGIGNTADASVANGKKVTYTAVVSDGTTSPIGRASDYNVTQPNVTVNIIKTMATAPSVEAYVGTYDGDAHGVSVTGGSGGTINYSSDRSNWSATPITKIDEGTYTVYVKVAGDSNHSDSNIITSSIKINKADLTITVVAKDKDYDGRLNIEIEVCSVTGMVNGETLNILCGNATVDDKNVGNNKTVTYDQALSDLTGKVSNYNYSFPEITVNINPREVVVEWTGPFTFPYDEKTHAVTAKITNVVSGETLSPTYSGHSYKDVGNYTSTIVSLNNGNYVLPATGISHAWEITPVNAVLTVTAKEGLIYNAEDQRLITDSLSTLDASLVTVTYKVKTPTASSATTVAEPNGRNAGTYTVIVTATSKSANVIGDEKTVTVKIEKRDISTVTIGTVASQEYTGNYITPKPSVSYAGSNLVLNTDYEYQYENHLNVGTNTAKVKVVALSTSVNFKGSVTISFTITAQKLAGDPILTGSPVYGSVLTMAYVSSNSGTPTYTIQWQIGTGSSWENLSVGNVDELELNSSTIGKTVVVDYKIRYILTAIGNYSGTLTSVATNAITKKSVTMNDIIATASGEVTREYDGTDLVSQSFDLEFANNVIEPGDTVTITDIPTRTAKYADKNVQNSKIVTMSVAVGGIHASNYDIVKTKTVTGSITSRSINYATVSDLEAEYVYVAKAITPTIKLTDTTLAVGSTVLVLNTDYTVAYDNNTNVGIATITITGKGNYKSEKIATFTIVAADFVYSLSGYGNILYDGLSHSVSVNVTYPTSGVTIKFGTSEGSITSATSPSYTNVVNTTVYIKIEKENYNTVITSVPLVIQPRDIGEYGSFSTIDNIVYTGSELTPSFTITDATLAAGKYTLVKNTDFTVVYSDNKNVGTAKVTATGTGNYTGTLETTFRITLALATLEVTNYVGEYDGDSHTLTVNSFGGTVEYRKNNSSTWSTNINSIAETNVGTYTVYVRLIGDANHESVEEKAYEIKINRFAVTVTANAGTMEYRGTVPTLTYKLNRTLPNSETLKGTLSIGKDSAEVNSFASRHIGTYGIAAGNVTNANNANYDIKFVSANFVVTDGLAPVINSHSAVADDESIEVDVEYTLASSVVFTVSGSDAAVSKDNTYALKLSVSLDNGSTFKTVKIENARSATYEYVFSIEENTNDEYRIMFKLEDAAGNSVVSETYLISILSLQWPESDYDTPKEQHNVKFIVPSYMKLTGKSDYSAIKYFFARTYNNTLPTENDFVNHGTGLNATYSTFSLAANGTATVTVLSPKGMNGEYRIYVRLETKNANIIYGQPTTINIAPIEAMAAKTLNFDVLGSTGASNGENSVVSLSSGGTSVVAENSDAISTMATVKFSDSKVYKYASNGTLLWEVTLKHNNELAYKKVIERENDILLIATGTATIVGNKNVSATEFANNLYLIRLSHDGVLLEVNAIEVLHTTYVTSAIDGNNIVVVLEGNAKNFKVMLLSDVGMVKWTKAISSVDMNINGVALNDEIVTLVGDNTAKNIEIDGISLSLGNRGDKDAFILTFDIDGSIRFFTTLAGTLEDSYSTVRINDNKIYVLGATRNTMLYIKEGGTIVNADRGSLDSMLVIYNINGKIEDHMFVSGQGDEKVTSIAFAGDEILLAATTNGTLIEPSAKCGKPITVNGNDRLSTVAFILHLDATSLLINTASEVDGSTAEVEDIVVNSTSKDITYLGVSVDAKAIFTQHTLVADDIHLIRNGKIVNITSNYRYESVVVYFEEEIVESTTSSFKVEKEGEYTVVVTDYEGVSVIKTITINNLETDAKVSRGYILEFIVIMAVVLVLAYRGFRFYKKKRKLA